MPNEDFRIQYLKYLKLLKGRKKQWLLPIIVFPILFFAASFSFPKIYEAKAIILIQGKNMVDPLMKDLVISSNFSEKISILKEEILAWPRLLLLIERIGLNKDIHGPEEMEKFILKIRGEINIQLHGDEVVSISYQGKNPSKTQSLVNTLSDILIEKNLSSQKEDTGSAIDFIKMQLDIYKNKLKESESALREFKEVYGDTLATSRGPVKKEEMQEENFYDGVTLRQINEKLNNLKTAMIFASVEYTDEHPQIIDLKKRIQILVEKRDQYIEKAAKKVGAKPESYLTIADSIPLQQETLSRLIRDNEINTKIYGMLLERYETVKITESLDRSSNKSKFRVIEPARLPLTPVKPDKMKFLLFGLFFGACVGFGLIYFFEITDPSFKTEDQIEKFCNRPLLGSISTIRIGD